VVHARAAAPPPNWRARVQALLQSRFRLRQLRPGQEEVIRHVLAGEDTLALMATGAGKSLCYQVPALLLPGRTVVISPLIALMKDQHDHLRALGIPVVLRHSGQLAAENEKAAQAMADGSARIVFTTPERLASPGFAQELGAHPVSLLVIDEAHCIAEWGHDFRPAFLEIGAALRKLGRPVVLALTATATPEDVADVMRQLDLADMQVVHTGLYRGNLHYAVDHVESEAAQRARLLTLVHGTPGQGIVYTSTVKAAEAVHAELQSSGESVALYHGHLARGRRHAAQDAFMAGEARVMVATPAFGMGIDKADTRFVIHHQLPASLASYYQASGRAGRDGLPARCTLLYLAQDRRIQQFFLIGRLPTVADLRAVHDQLGEEAAEAAGWRLPELEAVLARPRQKVQLAVWLMRRHGLLARDRHGVLRRRVDTLADEALAPLLEEHAQRKQHDLAMLENLVAYCQSGRCRWQMLLQHFDPDEPFSPCGHCDNCERLAAAQQQADQQAADSSLEAPPPADDLPRIQVGDAVRVPRYGRGHVLAIDDVGITVGFPNGPDRSFLPRYVRPA
jgi:ATP-dependent DNA helicase RecQ